MFAVQSDSLLLKETIDLKDNVKDSTVIQIKVFQDLIIHDYNAYTFYFVDKDHHHISEVSYKNNDLKLPIPVKNPIRISDFVQIGTNLLLVTETNSNSVYQVGQDNFFEKVIELEMVPFSIICHDSYIYLITNDFRSEYLIKFNLEYEEVDRLVIGNSFFRSGVRSYDRLVTGSKFFIRGDNLFIHNNDQDLYKCDLSEGNNINSTCEVILNAQESIYIGEKDESTLYYLNGKSLHLKNIRTSESRRFSSMKTFYSKYLSISEDLLYLYENGDILIYDFK